jgi:drug/metabolite transporter (DMT)-like permease
MRALISLWIAILTAIEVMIVTLVLVEAFVPLGGSGEFTGLNRLPYTIIGMTVVPFATFCVSSIVARYYVEKDEKLIRGIALYLLTSLLSFGMVLIFLAHIESRQYWALVVNLAVLGGGIVRVLWLRSEEIQSRSFEAGSSE